MAKKATQSRHNSRRTRKCAGFKYVSPKASGLQDAPFRALRSATKKEVHELRCLAGASHIVLHKGKCVFTYSQGWADVQNRVPFSLNTICKLHGCTKPLVAAAFLTLVDSRKVRLTDRVSKYIRYPDRVASSACAGTPKSSSRPATLHNLLTMTAGLGYDEFEAYKATIEKVEQGSITTLAELCDSILDAPLMANPGSRYAYSFATDVLGFVCEVISGKRLDQFLQDSLLKPLGMNDTHFVVPPRKHRRVAKLYVSRLHKNGKKLKGAPFSLRPWSGGAKSSTELMSAGGGILSYEDAGMFSTVRDYSQFCQMLLNRGRAPNGRRILKESTVKSLWKDGLAPYSGKDGRLRGWNDCEGIANRRVWDHMGLSILHAHVNLDSAPSATKPPRKGSSMWMAGGGGTGWAIDSKKELVSITFTQCFSGRKEDDGLGPSGDDAMPFALEAVDGHIVDGK